MAASFIASICAPAATYGSNSVTGVSGGAGSIDTTGATLLVAIIVSSIQGVPTMSDSALNVWSYGTQRNVSGLGTTRLAYVFNPNTSTTHTFNPLIPPGVEAASFVFAFGGVGTWSFDQEVFSSTLTSGTSVVAGPITPSSAGQVLIAACETFTAFGNSATVDSGFEGGQGVASGHALPQGISNSPASGVAAYLIDSGTSPLSPTFTVWNEPDWIWTLDAFKLTSGATISGSAGVAGATVAWTGTSSGSTTADGSGNYSIPNLANGSYTITPSKTGYVFSPTSHSETVSGSDITGVNFTATQVFSISGNCGVAGATVNLSGTASGTTTADGSGNFTFGGLLPGTYFITPTDSGTHFFMPNQMKRVLTGNVTLCNFGAIIPAHPYAELAYDSFQQADGPLNPVDWFTVAGNDSLVTVGGLCECDDSFNGFNLYTRASWSPTGQYVQIQLANLDAANSPSIIPFIFTDESETFGYSASAFFIGDTLFISVSNVATATGLINVSAPTPWVAGDLLMLQKDGDTVSLYYNNALIGSAVDVGSITDNAGMSLSGTVAVTDVQVIDFVAGSIAGHPSNLGGGGDLDFGMDFNF